MLLTITGESRHAVSKAYDMVCALIEHRYAEWREAKQVQQIGAGAYPTRKAAYDPPDELRATMRELAPSKDQGASGRGRWITSAVFPVNLLDGIQIRLSRLAGASSANVSAWDTGYFAAQMRGAVDDGEKSPAALSTVHLEISRDSPGRRAGFIGGVNGLLEGKGDTPVKGSVLQMVLMKFLLKSARDPAIWKQGLKSTWDPDYWNSLADIQLELRLKTQMSGEKPHRVWTVFVGYGTHGDKVEALLHKVLGSNSVEGRERRAAFGKLLAQDVSDAELRRPIFTGTVGEAARADEAQLKAQWEGNSVDKNAWERTVVLYDSIVKTQAQATDLLAEHIVRIQEEFAPYSQVLDMPESEKGAEQGATKEDREAQHERKRAEKQKELMAEMLQKVACYKGRDGTWVTKLQLREIGQADAAERILRNCRHDWAAPERSGTVKRAPQDRKAIEKKKKAALKKRQQSAKQQQQQQQQPQRQQQNGAPPPPPGAWQTGANPNWKPSPGSGSPPQPQPRPYPTGQHTAGAAKGGNATATHQQPGLTKEEVAAVVADKIETAMRQLAREERRPSAPAADPVAQRHAKEAVAKVDALAEEQQSQNRTIAEDLRSLRAAIEAAEARSKQETVAAKQAAEAATATAKQAEARVEEGSRLLKEQQTELHTINCTLQAMEAAAARQREREDERAQRAAKEQQRQAEMATARSAQESKMQQMQQEQMQHIQQMQAMMQQMQQQLARIQPQPQQMPTNAGGGQDPTAHATTPRRPGTPSRQRARDESDEAEGTTIGAEGEARGAKQRRGSRAVMDTLVSFRDAQARDQDVQRQQAGGGGGAAP